MKAIVMIAVGSILLLSTLYTGAIYFEFISTESKGLEINSLVATLLLGVSGIVSLWMGIAKRKDS